MGKLLSGVAVLMLVLGMSLTVAGCSGSATTAAKMTGDKKDEKMKE
jgi:hypothetical protein